MELARREFLKESMATLRFLALPGRLPLTVDIPISELPAGKTLTIAVRPISSLGTKGKAIATKYKA